jgi:hypothetical protein
LTTASQQKCATQNHRNNAVVRHIDLLEQFLRKTYFLRRFTRASASMNWMPKAGFSGADDSSESFAYVGRTSLL